MKFIFPQNYNFKNKFLGIIDYSTVFINLLWYIIIFFFVHILFNNLNLKIFIFISFTLPLLIFSISGLEGENIIYVFFYIFNFIFKQKLILYKK